MGRFVDHRGRILAPIGGGRAAGPDIEQRHAIRLGRVIPEHAVRKPRSVAQRIVEKIVVPREDDRHQGQFRLVRRNAAHSEIVDKRPIHLLETVGPNGRPAERVNDQIMARRADFHPPAEFGLEPGLHVAGRIGSEIGGCLAVVRGLVGRELPQLPVAGQERDLAIRPRERRPLDILAADGRFDHEARRGSGGQAERRLPDGDQAQRPAATRPAAAATRRLRKSGNHGAISSGSFQLYFENCPAAEATDE